MKKSQIASFLLTLFFGPLGLLYSSIIMSVIVIVLFCIITVLAPLSIYLLALPVWIFSIFWGALSVITYNAKLAKHEANLVNRMNPDNHESLKDERMGIIHYAILSVGVLLILYLYLQLG